MTDQLSEAAARAVLARETDEVFLARLRINPTAGAPLALINDTAEMTAGGVTYQPWAFEPTIPSDTDDSDNGVQLRMEDIEGEVRRRIREETGVPTAELEVVMASEPEHVQQGPFNFQIKQSEADQLAVVLSLGHEEDFVNQAVPAQTVTPSNSPGYFL